MTCFWRWRNEQYGGKDLQEADMRETIREWREEWIETNGPTGELEVVITDTGQDTNCAELYSGSFVDIPPELFDKKVIEDGRILASSVPERIGAYSLTI